MKTALLLVAQGGGTPEAEAVLARLEARVQRRFPAVAIRRAYAADRVRQRLVAQGQPAFSPTEALDDLQRAGCKGVAVASMHIVAGREYERLAAELTAYRHGRRALKGLSLSRPLLSSQAALRRVARALLARVPATRRAGDAVIVMGHGNANHPGDLAYLAAAEVFRRLDARAWLATLEDTPPLREVLAECRAAGVRKAFLLPFMALAGRHVLVDMAGPQRGSWSRRLARAGIEPVPLSRGLFEYPAVVTLWLEHAAEALRELEGRADSATRLLLVPR